QTSRSGKSPTARRRHPGFSAGEVSVEGAGQIIVSVLSRELDRQSGGRFTRHRLLVHLRSGLQNHPGGLQDSCQRGKFAGGYEDRRNRACPSERHVHRTAKGFLSVRCQKDKSYRGRGTGRARPAKLPDYRTKHPLPERPHLAKDQSLDAEALGEKNLASR